MKITNPELYHNWKMCFTDLKKKREMVKGKRFFFVFILANEMQRDNVKSSVFILSILSNRIESNQIEWKCIPSTCHLKVNLLHSVYNFFFLVVVFFFLIVLLFIQFIHKILLDFCEFFFYVGNLVVIVVNLIKRCF